MLGAWQGGAGGGVGLAEVASGGQLERWGRLAASHAAAQHLQTPEARK